MKEFEFLNIISKTLSNNSFLGDDCAHLGEYNLAISTDTLVEDVHFSFKYMRAYEIGTKAMLVNISDALASGAKPNYALISLSGKLDNNFIQNFYEAVNDVSKKYDITIIGGDLTGGDKVSVTITILADTKNRNISKRLNAKDGYIVAACGFFGHSAKGLKDLQDGICENEFILAHKKPKLYPKLSEITALNAKHPYAMMDASDGLFDCLYQISKKSKVEIKVDFDKIKTKLKDKSLILYGGEDYNLVMALKKEDYLKIKALSCDIYEIGICKENNKHSCVFIDNEEIKDNKSYNHF